MKNCKLCNEEITGRGKTELCIKCYYKSEKVHNVTWLGEYPRCISCGKQLSAHHVERCKSCENKNRAGKGIYNSKGENNGNYIDGRSFEEYPIEFTDELKESIRERDNYECKNCGMTEEEHIIVLGQVLHIHHIDYDKQNCNEQNLVSVCRQCNSRANSNRNYWTTFYQQKVKI
jgi:hypothetical protein